MAWMLFLLLVLFLLGCGGREESHPAGEGKIQEAVKEAVTKEFKIYEGAKGALEKADKASEDKREIEKAMN